MHKKREHAHKVANSGRIRAIDLPPPSDLIRLNQDSPGWSGAGDFIRETFAERYQARIHEVPATLMALRNDCGEITAVSGLRYAAGGQLFLEQYLDSSVENHLGSVGDIDRSRIVEICNLTAPTPGQVRYMMIALTTYLHSAGYEWVVCTVIGSLCNTLSRMRLTPVILGMADPARLGAAAADWGSYYVKSPQVIAGHLAEASSVLAANNSQPDSPAHLLWRNANRLGQQDRIAEPTRLGTARQKSRFGVVNA